MSVFQFLALLITAFGSVAAIAYYFSNLAEDGINETTKKKFANKFKALNVSSSTRSAFLLFLIASDRFYGARLFSTRAFATSASFSIFWFFSTLFVCAWYSPEFLFVYSIPFANNFLLKYAMFFLFTGVIIDFFSTVMTRIVIRLSLKNFNISLIFIAVADLLCSAILFYLAFSLAKYIMFHKPFPSFFIKLEQWSIPWSITADIAGNNNNIAGAVLKPGIGIIRLDGTPLEIIYAFPEGLLFFSSLLTSIWLWLYIASFWLHKAALRVDSVKTILLNISNVENKPFKSIGIITLIFIYPLIVILAVGAFAIYRQFS